MVLIRLQPATVKTSLPTIISLYIKIKTGFYNSSKWIDLWNMIAWKPLLSGRKSCMGGNGSGARQLWDWAQFGQILQKLTCRTAQKCWLWRSKWQPCRPLATLETLAHYFVWGPLFAWCAAIQWVTCTHYHCSNTKCPGAWVDAAQVLMGIQKLSLIEFSYDKPPPPPPPPSVPLSHLPFSPFSPLTLCPFLLRPPRVPRDMVLYLLPCKHIWEADAHQVENRHQEYSHSPIFV